MLFEKHMSHFDLLPVIRLCAALYEKLTGL